MAPTSSGSAWSERAVKPTRSQKSTVMILRSSPAGCLVSGRGAPQAPQNRKPAGFWAPQPAQVGTAPLTRSGARLGCRGAAPLCDLVQRVVVDMVAGDDGDPAGGEGAQGGGAVAVVEQGHLAEDGAGADPGDSSSPQGVLRTKASRNQVW